MWFTASKGHAWNHRPRRITGICCYFKIFMFQLQHCIFSVDRYGEKISFFFCPYLPGIRALQLNSFNKTDSFHYHYEFRTLMRLVFFLNSTQIWRLYWPAQSWLMQISAFWLKTECGVENHDNGRWNNPSRYSPSYTGSQKCTTTNGQNFEGLRDFKNSLLTTIA